MNYVFVIGVPRSGTTLLQSILASFPNVYSIPETHIFSISAEIGIEPFDMLGMDQQAQLINALANRMKGLFKAYPSHIISQEILAKTFINNILIELSKQWNEKFTDEAKNTLVEKTPGHSLHLKLIHSFYPDAKFIHIVRNPLDVISSINQSFSRIRSLTPRIRLWKRYIDQINTFKNDNANRVLEVSFNGLVNNPEEETKILSKFLNLNIERTGLINLEESYSTLSLDHETWKHTRKSSSIENRTDKWKAYLTQDQAWFISFCLRKYFEAYGFRSIGTSIFKKIKVIIEEVLLYIKYKLES